MILLLTAVNLVQSTPMMHKQVQELRQDCMAQVSMLILNRARERSTLSSLWLVSARSICHRLCSSDKKDLSCGWIKWEVCSGMLIMLMLLCEAQTKSSWSRGQPELAQFLEGYSVAIPFRTATYLNLWRHVVLWTPKRRCTEEGQNGPAWNASTDSCTLLLSKLGCWVVRGSILVLFMQEIVAYGFPSRNNLLLVVKYISS
jgi:hypothetical protein